MTVVAVWVPDPVGVIEDSLSAVAGQVAGAGFDVVIGGLSSWVLGAIGWIVGAVFEFFSTATSPNLEADWFRAGPYATTTTIAAVLMVAFVFAGVIQGVLAGDTGGLIRLVTVEVPLSVLAMVGLVGGVQLLIAVTDALADGLMARFGQDMTQFRDLVTAIDTRTVGAASGFVVVVLAVIAVFAGIVLIGELVVRAALIYLVVALAPLVFAARAWPALAGMTRKLIESIAALVLAKLVVAVALTVASAAAVGTTSPAATTLAAPEAAPTTAATTAGSEATQTVGVLLAALTTFGVAAFSPLMIARLFPLTEAALVAHGLRGAPMRASRHLIALSATTATSATRLTRLAGPATTAAPTPPPPQNLTARPVTSDPAVPAEPDPRRAPR